MSKVPDKKKNINTSKNSKSGGNDQGKSNKNNEGDDDNELEEPEQGCCDKFAACLIVVFKFIYTVLKFIINSIKQCCGFWWYPAKEKCCYCVDRMDKKLNPYKDEGFTNV